MFLKYKKHHFDAFQHEKHFKKQLQPHFQTSTSHPRSFNDMYPMACIYTGILINVFFIVLNIKYNFFLNKKKYYFNILKKNNHYYTLKHPLNLYQQNQYILITINN